jgi:uncharacterized protein YheU (UPF0270 family)
LILGGVKEKTNSLFCNNPPKTLFLVESAQGFQIITSVHKNKTDFGKALEMLIQNVYGQCIQGRLVIQWENHCEALANCVEIGTNQELTENRKLFVLPVTTNCALATGTGKFFYRVGAFVGEKLRGTIEWSGLYSLSYRYLRTLLRNH